MLDYEVLKYEARSAKFCLWEKLRDINIFFRKLVYFLRRFGIFTTKTIPSDPAYWREN